MSAKQEKKVRKEVRKIAGAHFEKVVTDFNNVLDGMCKKAFRQRCVIAWNILLGNSPLKEKTDETN